MSVNLIDLFHSEIGEDLIKHASAYLNEPKDNTHKAVGGILPSLMGSVADRAHSKSGAEEIMDMLSKGNFDGGMLSRFGDIMKGGGNDLSSLLDQGKVLLGSLLGDKHDPLTDMISNYSGVKSQSASTLMRMVAPLLLSLLGRRVQKQGLDLGGLMSMLGDQIPHIKGALPGGLAGIGNLLGFKGELSKLGAKVDQAADAVGDAARETADAVGEAAQKAADAVSDAARESAEAVSAANQKSGTNWLPWVLGAIVVVVLIYFLMRG